MIPTYTKPTEAQNLATAEEISRINSTVKSVIETGKACLSDERFKKYKEEYERAREAIINFMIEHTDADPVRDAFMLRSCLAKLAVIRDLIAFVEKDANKKAL